VSFSNTAGDAHAATITVIRTSVTDGAAADDADAILIVISVVVVVDVFISCVTILVAILNIVREVDLFRVLLLLLILINPQRLLCRDLLLLFLLVSLLCSTSFLSQQT
jgi:hypothetical protein